MNEPVKGVHAAERGSGTGQNQNTDGALYYPADLGLTENSDVCARLL